MEQTSYQPQPFDSQEISPSHRSIIVRLIWIYFWLLLFEGALRKWALPSLSTPLLIIRDPFVLMIYFYALYVGRFPKHWSVTGSILIGGLLFFFSIFQAAFFNQGTLIISLYGLRADFLHIPLIWIIGNHFKKEDLQTMGRWVLVLAIPMALLMAYQFISPASSWINRGAEEGTDQISAALGKIRPPGTFSFISGPIFFFSLVTAFWIGEFLENQRRSKFLLLFSGISLLVALSVSGSRSTLAYTLVTASALPLCWLFKPRTFITTFPLILILILSGLFLYTLPVVKEGLTVFETRIQQASEHEGGLSGFISRFSDDILKPIRNIPDLPILGSGLGVGTNVGAVLLTGERDFLLEEEEYGRVLAESGPILGGFFLLFRMAIVVWIGMEAFRSLRSGHLLSCFLFFACFINLIRGQWGQPTTSGFGILIAGLCLTSSRLSPLPHLESKPVESDESAAGIFRQTA